MAASRCSGSAPVTWSSAVLNRSNPSRHSASAIPALAPNIVYRTLVEHPASAAIRRMVSPSGPCRSSSSLAVSSNIRRSDALPAAWATAYGLLMLGWGIRSALFGTRLRRGNRKRNIVTA